MSTNAENLVKISPVLAEIFGGIYHAVSFQILHSPPVISWVSEPILSKFA